MPSSISSSPAIFAIAAIALFSSAAVEGNGRTIRVRYPWMATTVAEDNERMPPVVEGRRTMTVPQAQQRLRPKSAIVLERTGLMMNGGGSWRRSNRMANEKLQRRKLVSARYQSIFGHSKPIRGSEFVPANIEQYTGKLATSRRETFNWAPSGNMASHFLFPRY